MKRKKSISVLLSLVMVIALTLSSLTIIPAKEVQATSTITQTKTYAGFARATISFERYGSKVRNGRIISCSGIGLWSYVPYTRILQTNRQGTQYLLYTNGIRMIGAGSDREHVECHFVFQ